MGWKHIAVEGYCLVSLKDGEDLEIPDYCNHEPGNIGLKCFSLVNEEKKVCPYFSFGKARTSLALIGEDGEVVDGKVFWSEGDLANEEVWIKKEKEWIEKWREKMEKED